MINCLKSAALAGLIATTVPFVAGTDFAMAASGEWFKTHGGKMRLITAAEPDSREIRAALEVQLEEGWKTYWRAPGDSGIPPSFNFLRSQNVESAEVSYPTPSLYIENGTQIVGYKHQVVFPIKVITSKLGQSSELKLDLLIGICADICIPVQADLSVTEPATGGPSFEVARLLAESAQTLPGEPLPDFQINRAIWENDNPTSLRIKTSIPETAESIQLHVEGPQDWYLLTAKMAAQMGAEAEFILDISDIPAGALPTKTELRFTLVVDGKSIEQLLVPSE